MLYSLPAICDKFFIIILYFCRECNSFGDIYYITLIFFPPFSIIFLSLFSIIVYLNHCFTIFLILFHNISSCTSASDVLELALTSSQEPILCISSQFHVQWCHVGGLQLTHDGSTCTTAISKHYTSKLSLFLIKNTLKARSPAHHWG